MLYMFSLTTVRTGSIFYFFGALRDGGWAWFMPLAGRCNTACPACPDDYGPHPVEVGAGPAEIEYWGPSWGTEELDIDDGGGATAPKSSHGHGHHTAGGAKEDDLTQSPDTRLSHRALRGGGSQRFNVLTTAATATGDHRSLMNPTPITSGSSSSDRDVSR